MPTEHRAEKIVGLLLAAGGGTRFLGPGHKLSSGLRGRPVIDWALDAALASRRAGRLDGLIIVTGPAPVTIPAGVIEVPNPAWADGQTQSLRLGLQTAGTLGADAVVVGLGDQPFVTGRAWSSIAAARTPIAVATYDGVRGHPVRLHRSVWPLLPDVGDQGARSLMTLRPELVGEVACTGSLADIDTMEDLHQWNSSTNSP